MKPTQKLEPRPQVVYLYSRVSTNEQTTEQQEMACRKYVEEFKAAQAGDEDDSGPRLKAGFVLATARDLGVSGGVEFKKRPKGAEVIAALKKDDWLVVSKLDRAFRSCRDCLNVVEELKKKGVKLHILDLQFGTNACITNGINKLFVSIMSAIAEWEKSRIGDRTREKLALKRANGEFTGGNAPWDMNVVDGKVVPNKKRSELLVKMKRWRRESMPLREIRDRIALAKEQVSLKTISRLTDDVAPAETKRRGRRARVTGVVG